MTFYVFFNDQYLINYSTDHITTEPIRKIESELYIHILNFNHILTEITIKTNDRQGNSEFLWKLDWSTAYEVLILMNIQGPDILVITQPIELKPSLFARLGRKYVIKVSFKI